MSSASALGSWTFCSSPAYVPIASSGNVPVFQLAQRPPAQPGQRPRRELAQRPHVQPGQHPQLHMAPEAPCERDFKTCIDFKNWSGFTARAAGRAR